MRRESGRGILGEQRRYSKAGTSKKMAPASITNLTAKMSEDSERIFEAPQWGPLGSKGSWASPPISDCPSFSLILSMNPW
ncbi:hypothetical protein WN51_13591 [Melipona quadrifasciata]|uniref:Uncharacterized protein n=1 Tax=Melipona quadrifasciata TaxID=166423 RepID=A0A0M8ZZF0_9HYME|nr:hypothetical protein WN51_13591 [Melipona quadrifasciata]